MKDKVLNIVYGIPIVLVAGALCYFLAINPPHFVNLIFQIGSSMVILMGLLAYAYIRVKERFVKFIKGIVKKVLKEINAE